ncbi:hypothetical protein G7Y89_g6157 [Cudoniella acicularis]|uniref:Uncharacterized protein n=1 Tax=Cudoniella acicularis TaxID=354080 RepID=A0A8H4W350_9HELO|nr:hypothetical protein G7Y89_g6157 [Cudoniella acicularis]
MSTLYSKGLASNSSNLIARQLADGQWRENVLKTADDVALDKLNGDIDLASLYILSEITQVARLPLVADDSIFSRTIPSILENTITPAWNPSNETFEGLNYSNPLQLNTTSEFQGHICETGYYQANLPVTIFNTGQSSAFNFDTNEHNRTKIPIDPNSWDLPSFDVPSMNSNSFLSDQARQVRQRFKGESVQAVLQNLGQEQSQSIQGRAAVSERRVVVSLVISTLLSVAFFWSAFMLIVAAINTLLLNRPLNLLRNPSSSSVITSIVTSEPSTRALFDGLDRSSEEAMMRALEGYYFSLSGGILYTHKAKESFQKLEPDFKRKIPSTDWQPEAVQFSLKLASKLSTSRVPVLIRHKVTVGTLSNVFGILLTGWMYSSIIEGTYNSTPSPWTNDDWAFVPLDLSSIPDLFDEISSNSSSTNLGASNNVTVTTPSIRARLECISLDMSNTSAWLYKLKFTNKTAWNSTNIPADLDFSYELKLGLSMNQSANGKWTYWDDLNPYFSSFAADYRMMCCTNENIPKVTALNCTPIYESANTSVTVGLATGIVQNHTILDTLAPDQNAWPNNLIDLNVSTGIPYSSSMYVGSGYQITPRVYVHNISVNYGYLFHDTLLGAANSDLTGSNAMYVDQAENLDDCTFNFRLPGLNVDFMSYTSLNLVNQDKAFLLDPTTLGNASSEVFSLFFKHFVHGDVKGNNGLYINGIRGLQPRGAVIPSNLRPTMPQGYKKTVTYLQDSFKISNTAPSATATITTRIEQFDLIPAAVILCLCILVLLAITACFIFIGLKAGKGLDVCRGCRDA